MPLRVAVTGGTGFIGRHLVSALVERGATVTVASRRPAEIDIRGGDVRAVEMDVIGDPEGAYERLGRPDILFHLAWEHLRDYHNLAHFEVQLPRHYAFLKRLISDGLGCLIATGTCFEYGLRAGALDEDDPCVPVTTYGLAKLTLCRQLEHLGRRHPFAMVWARLFYAFGPGQSPGGLWSQLQAALREGAPTFNMSGGEQLRDFLPVETLATSLASLGLAGANFGIVNVCSGNPRSIRALVEDWVAQSGRKIDLNLGHYPYADYEPMASWGRPDKLERILAGRHDG